MTRSSILPENAPHSDEFIHHYAVERRNDHVTNKFVTTWWNASSQLLEPRVMQRALLGDRSVCFGEQIARPVEIARVERVFKRLQFGNERAERVRDVRLIGQTDVAPDAPCAAREPRH